MVPLIWLRALIRMAIPVLTWLSDAPSAGAKM
jgi:hypothetical protein